MGRKPLPTISAEKGTTMACTKIVCTIGPASRESDTLRAMVEAGMRVARLNFSHGTEEEHRTVFHRLRQISEETGVPLSIVQDLCGPKIRIGSFKEDRVFLKPGEPFVLTREAVAGDERQVQVDLSCLTETAQVGGRVLLSDGLIELLITGVEASRVITEVGVGGWLSSRKGISFPGCRLPMEPMTDKDHADLAVGLDLGVDYVALSFVRQREDMLRLKALIAERGSQARVIAKLERPEALEDLDGILDVSDVVMVARGDLGIEIRPEKVPLVQKRIIRESRRHDVCVITATQMLESMIHNPWPTRAEASDVANAVLDGTDAVMLSGETAAGQYPVRAVEIMNRIADETERERADMDNRRWGDSVHKGSFPGAIGWAAVHIADLTGARVICAFTLSGATANLISKLHPEVPILGLTPSERVLTQLGLAWGVTPVLTDAVPSLDAMIQEVERVVVERALAEVGDTIVLVAGVPLEQPGLTNLLKVHNVGQPDPAEWHAFERK